MTQYKDYRLKVTSTINKPGLSKIDIRKIEIILNELSTTDLHFELEEME